jgi:hypothetical protein
MPSTDPCSRKHLLQLQNESSKPYSVVAVKVSPAVSGCPAGLTPFADNFTCNANMMLPALTG